MSKKYNKIIVGGCSFVANIHDEEDLSRNSHPEYVLNIKKQNKDKNDSELKKIIIELRDSGKVPYRKTWWNLLSEELNLEVISFAEGGNSNPAIFRDIINYLINNEYEQNNLIIIGLTSLFRLSRWIEDKQRYINIHLKIDNDDIRKIYNHEFFNNRDLVNYIEIYLKYMYDDFNKLKEVQHNLDLLKFICKKQNHKLLIFDNLMLGTWVYSNRKEVSFYMDKFRKKNHNYLLYFKDEIFCYPEYIKTYDSDYKLTHLNTKDHKIFFDIIKDKI